MVDEASELDSRMALVYLFEVAREVRIGLDACELLAEPTSPADAQIADALLIATTRICRLVRAPGSGRWKSRRRATLQRLLGVAPEPPEGDSTEDPWPLGSREVRNASDHFDERIDDFLRTTPPPTAEEVEAGPGNYSWAFPWRSVVRDPELKIQVAGDEILVAPLCEELRRLAALLPTLSVVMNGPPDFNLGFLVAGFPDELRLSAPTRRPHEHVMTGVDPQTSPPAPA